VVLFLCATFVFVNDAQAGASSHGSLDAPTTDQGEARSPDSRATQVYYRTSTTWLGWWDLSFRVGNLCGCSRSGDNQLSFSQYPNPGSTYYFSGGGQRTALIQLLRNWRQVWRDGSEQKESVLQGDIQPNNAWIFLIIIF